MAAVRETSEQPGTRRAELRRARRAAGHTQEVFGMLTGVGAQTVRRWEAGRQDPQPGRIPRIARVLSLSVPATAALFDTHAAEAPDPLNTALEVRSAVEQLRAAYAVQPSSALLLDTVTLLSRLDEARPAAGGARTVREIDTADAEASLLLAQLVWDATGRRDRASVALLLARSRNAARRSGDALALSYALLRSAYLELYGGDPETGVQLADKAARVAEPVSPALAALARTHVAEGHAMAGRAEAVRRALDAAAANLEEAPADDAGHPLCPPSTMPRMTGSCHLLLGHHDRARESLALALRTASSDKTRALILGNISLAALGAGDLDQSTAALNRAATLIAGFSGAGALAVAAKAAAALLRRYPTEKTVAEAAGRVLELVASPS